MTDEADDFLEMTNDETIDLIMIGLDYLTHEGDPQQIAHALWARFKETNVPTMQQVSIITARLQDALQHIAAGN